MKNVILLFLLAGVLIVFFSLFPSKGTPEKSGTEGQPTRQPQSSSSSNPAVSKESSDQVPKMQIDMTKKYLAVLKTTAGEVTVELNVAKTPMTVNNFVSLSRSGFYNNTIFHRVMKGFMIQGGDPKGDGTGGPGYKFDDEPFDGEYTRGTIAMANAGPNTNGSQFFIMHQDYKLSKNYVIFGNVVKGLEVVDKIATAEVTAGPSGEPSKPVTPVKITSVEILEQ